MARVVRLTAKHDRALDDLRAELEDWEPSPDGDTWQDTVESAMNTAWDALLKAGDPA